MFELRWPLIGYRDRGPGMLSDFMLGRLADAEAQTLEDYRAMLAKREDIRKAFAALKGKADGFITLSSPGPAPKAGSLSTTLSSSQRQGCQRLIGPSMRWRRMMTAT